MFIRAESEGSIHGAKIGKIGPSILHLLFANDSFLFCNAFTDEAREVKNIIDDYCETSGQMVNFNR